MKNNDEKIITSFLIWIVNSSKQKVILSMFYDSNLIFRVKKDLDPLFTAPHDLY